MRGAIPILSVFFLVETELVALGPLAPVLLVLYDLWKENWGQKKRHLK